MSQIFCAAAPCPAADTAAREKREREVIDTWLPLFQRADIFYWMPTRGYADDVRWERLVHPLRFLCLLPLSHVFGQMMGIFVPQLLGAESHAADDSRCGTIGERMSGTRRCTLSGELHLHRGRIAAGA